MAFPSLFWIVQFCLTIVLHSCKCSCQKIPKFSALLVFGDSVFDTGNNNDMNTVFKANYHPYGMHFPGGIPTGRVSDGKVVPDMLASMLGLKETLPPFLQPNLSDSELLTGVCFASAGAGLDDQTNAILKAIPMSKQPGYLKDYIDRLATIVGRGEAQQVVNKALVLVHAGAVDFIYHFYVLSSNRRLEFTINEYQDFLLHNLQNFLEEIYYLGCRSILVAGLAPLGCLPFTITANSPFSRTCIEHINSEAQSYNEKLVKLLSQLQAKLPGSKIMYADTYNPLMDMISHPLEYGFVETARGCCGTGYMEMGWPSCNPLTPVCRNSSQYIFWDVVHPTQAAYQYLSQSLAKEYIPKFI